MTDFGDFEPDDAYDTASADPEQVARKLVEFEAKARWEDIPLTERISRLVVMSRLLDWLRRSGHFR